LFYGISIAVIAPSFWLSRS